jgi:quercetin dioxygenase-like cupin family protein
MREVAPDALKLTPGESVTIKRSSPELLEVEGSYSPGGNPPPPHYHPAQDEHFEVLEGAVRVRIEGEERELDREETLDIPRGKIRGRSPSASF